MSILLSVLIIKFLALSPDSNVFFPSASMKDSSLLHAQIGSDYLFLTPGCFCHELGGQRKLLCPHRESVLCFVRSGAGVVPSCTGFFMPAPGNQSLFWRRYHIGQPHEEAPWQPEIEAQNAVPVSESDWIEIMPNLCLASLDKKHTHREVTEPVAHAPFKIRAHLGEVWP